MIAVSVNVNNGGRIIPIKIKCGDGTQSFKWLATVIESRIKQYNLLRASFEKEQFIVSELKNVDGELLNPLDQIYEHAIGPSLQIEAVVSKEYPLDEWENPNMSSWMKGAYLNSEDGLRYANEIEAWRESVNNQKSTNRNMQNARPTTSFIKIGYDFSEADIQSAFELDWQSMKWPWLENASESHKNQIGRVLSQRYGMVCNVFAHYCGIGQIGQRYGLSINEFGHLLHSLHICNFRTSEELTEEIYYKTGHVGSMLGRASSSSSSRKEDLPSSTQYPLMTRAHLAEALIFIAMEQVALEESTTGQLIEAFFLGPLESLWSKITTSYLLYTSRDPAIKSTTMSYHQLLKRSFNARASPDPKFGPRLPLGDFIDMMIQSGLVDRAEEQMCLRVFQDVHFNPSPDRELSDVVFCEFLEAASRLACTAINHNDDLEFVKRIRLGFEMLVELNPVNNSDQFESKRSGGTDLSANRFKHK
jgi:hypothetical protein